MGHDGHGGGTRTTIIGALAGRVIRTRERTVATYVAVLHVEVEHEDPRQLSLFGGEARAGFGPSSIAPSISPVRPMLRPLARVHALPRPIEAEPVAANVESMDSESAKSASEAA